MVGQAFGGVFPAIVDILVVAINIEPQNEGFACLLIATLSLLLRYEKLILQGILKYFSMLCVYIWTIKMYFDIYLCFLILVLWHLLEQGVQLSFDTMLEKKVVASF